MLIYFNLDKNNRLQGWSSVESDGEFSLEVPTHHEVIRNPFIFRYENGELIKDAEYQEVLVKEKQERLNRLSPEEEIKALKKRNADLAFELMMKGVL